MPQLRPAPAKGAVRWEREVCPKKLRSIRASRRSQKDKPLITDSELLLGLARHLSTFAVNPSTALLDSLGYAGKLYELAWRLRGSGVNTRQRVHAIAVEAGISPRELRDSILPALEQLGWVQILRQADKMLAGLAETVPPPDELVAAAPRVLEICMPSDPERAALVLLHSTSRQPLEEEAALAEALVGGRIDEQACRTALRALESIGLVRRVTGEDGRVALFNPNVWVGDAEVTAAALRAEDARVRTEVGSLIEEVSARQGMPEAHVRSTELRWVDFAVAHGLVQRSVVQTVGGVEQRFLFTPHLSRGAFGGDPKDPSGHARQLVGSMIYAATFAEYKLRSPAAFVRALLRDGEAGDASPIGTDYPMLETAGIVRVAPGSSDNRFRLQLLQANVAEESLGILDERGSADIDRSTRAGLRGQSSYIHLERERARFAVEANVDSEDRRRLMSALRETVARRRFSG